MQNDQSQSRPPEPPNDPTIGVDSVGKMLRRNLRGGRFFSLFGRGADTLRRRGAQALWREVAFRWNLLFHREVWRYRADVPLRRELRAQKQNPPQPAPLVSVISPLYNTPKRYLRQMISSVLKQSYAHFELILCDASDSEEPGKLARRYAEKDQRIRYIRLAENKGIAANTNAGIEQSRGEWITLLDHDDVLQPGALYEVAQAAAQTGAELVYSDEVVLNENLKKLVEFHFKGDYGPDTLRGCNYITHLCAFTRRLLEAAGGGECPAYDGAQDFDLILRLSEQAAKIHHIPKVLYFWRQHEASTASGIVQKPAAAAAGAAAVQAQLNRLRLAGSVEAQKDHPGSYRVHYQMQSRPQLTVLIPSSDHADDLARCLASLYEKGGWPCFDVLVLDNNSKDPSTPDYYKEAEKQYDNLQILHFDGPFNFSAINNFGARHAKGEQLLLLNNDVEILSEGFLQEMLCYSQRPDVGAVGAMLYYPDDTVQHAGLILGIGGMAGVSHKGHARGDGGDLFRLCTTQNVSAVTGAAMMVKKELYLSMGGLDEENFAVAFNDVDFCLRLREKGLWNVFTPFAAAYHYESKSRGYDTEGPRKQRFEAEAGRFRTRWAGLLSQGDPFYNPHFTLKTENFALR